MEKKIDNMIGPAFTREGSDEGQRFSGGVNPLPLG